MQILDSVAYDLRFVEERKADITKCFEINVVELFGCRFELSELKGVHLLLKSHEYLKI